MPLRQLSVQNTTEATNRCRIALLAPQLNCSQLATMLLKGVPEAGSLYVCDMHGKLVQRAVESAEKRGKAFDASTLGEPEPVAEKPVEKK